MSSDAAYWRRQPLLFGQVREDAGVERWLAAQHGSVRRAVVIASAGCTALSLVDLVSDQLNAVDINPLQVAFAEIKLSALRMLERDEFVRLLCGSPAVPKELMAGLPPASCRLLARLEPRLANGLQNAGRVDGFLRLLRTMLFATVHSRDFVRDFLCLESVDAQRARFDVAWDTWRWRAATALAFNRGSLLMGFGVSAARQLPGSFAACIRAKVRAGLTRFPCHTNGYAWQSLLGEYPPNADAALPVYMQPEGFSECGRHLHKLRITAMDVRAWLDEQRAASIDFFALSNILELSLPKDSGVLMRSIERAAAPGALVCLRGILPNANFPARAGGLRLDESLSVQSAERDRSIVCNVFHIYRAAE
jgi:S-adenosylmethionine-diacylglycerol 3-amino-3-carboxypropyl transferase